MVDGASDDDGSNGPRLTSERSDVEKVNFIAFTEEQNINIILLSLLFNIPCHFLIKYARSAVGLSAKSFQILILLIPSKKLLPSIFPQISNGNSHPSLAISRPLPSIFHTTFPHCPHSFPTFSLLFFPRIIILILSDRQIQVRIGPLPPSRSNTPLLATFPHSTSVEAHCQRPMALRSSGEIHVILGPMFAGKTTALLRRMQAEIDCGRSVAMIKSDKDTRYGLESVVTYDGVKMACFALSELSTFREKLGAAAYDKLNVIGIDEAQFFEDLYDFCSNAADRDGKIVVVAGLDGDYLRRRFGSVLDVVPLADSVTKLTARCDICGKRAFFTRRKINEVEIELIGGADVYTPVCRQHYLDGHVAVEATRTILTVKTSPMIQNLKQLI